LIANIKYSTATRKFRYATLATLYGENHLRLVFVLRDEQ